MAGTMTEERKLFNLMSALADSVEELSDEQIMEEAEGSSEEIRRVLRKAVSRYYAANAAGTGALNAVEHYNWLCGVTDALKILEGKKRYLTSLSPACSPVQAVIEVLDELIVEVTAMKNRGSYSHSSTLMKEEEKPLEPRWHCSCGNCNIPAYLSVCDRCGKSKRSCEPVK